MIQLCNRVKADRSSTFKADPYLVQSGESSAQLSGLWRELTLQGQTHHACCFVQVSRLAQQ